MTDKFGGIQFIDNCIRIADIDKNIDKIKNNLNKLIASSIASYLCCFIIGVRDRHHDNILIEIKNSNLFHIDFAYILGEKVTGIDTSKIAIPNNFVKILGNDKWMEFIDMVCKCFIIYVY